MRSLWNFKSKPLSFTQMDVLILKKPFSSYMLSEWERLEEKKLEKKLVSLEADDVITIHFDYYNFFFIFCTHRFQCVCVACCLFLCFKKIELKKVSPRMTWMRDFNPPIQLVYINLMLWGKPGVEIFKNFLKFTIPLFLNPCKCLIYIFSHKLIK